MLSDMLGLSSSSVFSSEEVHVWTQMSKWDAPQFLQTLYLETRQINPGEVESVNTAGDPPLDSTRASGGVDDAWWKYQKKTNIKYILDLAATLFTPVTPKGFCGL